MFKRRIPLMSAAFLLVSMLASQRVAYPSSEAEWTLVAPPDEGFSVRMPVKPADETDRVPMLGNTYLMRMYSSVDEPTGMVYMVVMQEVSSVAGALEPSKRIEQFMKGFQEGMAKSMANVKLEITPDRDLDLKGHFGRQYKLAVADSRGVVRAFDATTRVYVLVALGGDERKSGVRLFLDSFEITPAPAPVPKPIPSN